MSEFKTKELVKHEILLENAQVVVVSSCTLKVSNRAISRHYLTQHYDAQQEAPPESIMPSI